MSLHRAEELGPRVGFPRVSGDEPGWATVDDARV